MGNKVLLFFFQSDFNGFADKGVLENGSILYEKGDSRYEFVVGDVKPIMFNSGSLLKSIQPMYFVKWDELIPVNFEIEENPVELDDSELDKIRSQVFAKKEETDSKIRKIIPKKKKVIRKSLVMLSPTQMKFSGQTKVTGTDGKSRVVLPEMLRSTTDMRFLKSMKEASMMTGKRHFKYRNILLALVFIGSVGFFTLYSLAYLNVI